MAKNGDRLKSAASDEEEQDNEASSEEDGSQEWESEPQHTQVTRMPSSSTPPTLKKTKPRSSSPPQEQQKQPASSSNKEESDNIKRPKKKSENKRNNEKRRVRTFSMAHEQKAYALSKKMWEKDNGKEIGVEKVIGTPSKRDVTWFLGEDEQNFKDLQNWFLSAGNALFDRREGQDEGAKEWKKLKCEEMALNLRELELRTARTKLVLDILRSCNN